MGVRPSGFHILAMHGYCIPQLIIKPDCSKTWHPYTGTVSYYTQNYKRAVANRSISYDLSKKWEAETFGCGMCCTMGTFASHMCPAPARWVSGRTHKRWRGSRYT